MDALFSNNDQLLASNAVGSFTFVTIVMTFFASSLSNLKTSLPFSASEEASSASDALTNAIS